MSFLIVMATLGLVFVVPLALLAEGPMLGLLVLVPMLFAGMAIATWWTLRFLDLEEEGDPTIWPARRELRHRDATTSRATQERRGRGAQSPPCPASR